MALTSSSWKGQEEKANFVLRMDGVYNPHFIHGVCTEVRLLCCFG